MVARPLAAFLRRLIAPFHHRQTPSRRGRVFESDISWMCECIEHAARRETYAKTGSDQHHSGTELCSKEQRHRRPEQCRKDECRQAETWRRPRAVRSSHRHGNRCTEQCREGDPQVTKVVPRPDRANERESKGNGAEQNRERLRPTLLMRRLHLGRPVVSRTVGDFRYTHRGVDSGMISRRKRRIISRR